jgi:hypothetical protein
MRPAVKRLLMNNDPHKLDYDRPPPRWTVDDLLVAFMWTSLGVLAFTWFFLAALMARPAAW